MRAIFGVGTIDRTGVPLGNVEQLRMDAINLLSHRFGGCSSVNVLGGWIEPIGEHLETEAGINFIVDGVPGKDEVRETAEDLRSMFNQQTVIVTLHETETLYVNYEDAECGKRTTRRTDNVEVHEQEFAGEYA